MVLDPGPTEPSPKSMFNFAIEYSKASKLLLEHHMITLMPQGPLYYLISHAFELFAKSYLMFKGLTYKELKDIGHGAKGIIKKCKELGLNINENDLLFADVIDNLNRHNMQRYPMLGFFVIGPIGFCEPDNMIAHLDDFCKRVSQIIGVKNAENH